MTTSEIGSHSPGKRTHRPIENESADINPADITSRSPCDSSVPPPTMIGPSASYFDHSYDSTPSQFKGDYGDWVKEFSSTNHHLPDPILTPPLPVYIGQSTDSLSPTAPYSPIQQQDSGSSSAGFFGPNSYSSHGSFSSPPGAALSFNMAGEAQFANATNQFTDAVTYSPQELYFPGSQQTSFSQHQLGGSSFPPPDTSNSPQDWSYGSWKSQLSTLSPHRMSDGVGLGAGLGPSIATSSTVPKPSPIGSYHQVTHASTYPTHGQGVRTGSTGASPTHGQIHGTSSSTSPVHPRSVTKTKRTHQRPVPYQRGGRGGRAGKGPASDSGDDRHRPPASGHQASASGQVGGGAQANGSGQQLQANGRPLAVTVRPPGACVHCKKLKMRCEFKDDENRCKRCKDSGKECSVEGRKPRPPINKREQLQAQLRDKEALIQTLLKQLHNPPLLPIAPTSSQNLAPIAGTSGTSSGSKDERVHKDVLAWIEKAQAAGRAQNVDKGSFLLDTRGILDPNESESEEEVDNDSSADEDMNPDSLSKGPANGKPTNGKGKQKMEKRKENNSPKLHALPEKTTPIGLLAHLSLSETKGRARSRGQPSSCGDLATDGGGEDEGRPGGLADPDYFRPGPAADPDLRRIIIERQMAPEILTSGLITPDEVEKLFGIFFDKLNVFLSILDPVIHTPATIFGRCPFLFTVICAISSRYYTERPDLYHVAMHYAKTSAASTLIDGWKSVEICQAYILLTVYPGPARRWEEDRTWLYLGLGIRMATDLNLHQPSTTKIINEQHEREILNRTRTWLICFNLDRSCSAQLGKPTTIREDWIIRNSKEWYKKSKYNFKMDIHLCTYSTLLRIMARFQEVAYSDPNSPTGLNRKLDYRAVTFSFDEELKTFKAEADAKFHVHSDKTDPVCVYRAALLPFLVNYSRLVILSFGFQQAYQKGMSPGDDVVVRCLDTASAVVSIMVNNLAPKDYLRYAPDGHFVFAAFASAFLIKMLRLEFKSLLDDDQRSRVIQLVGKLIKVLGSPEVAVDDRHTPKLYAKFLAGLLSKYVIRPGERRVTTNENGSGLNGAVRRNEVANGMTNGIHDNSTTNGAGGRQTAMDGVVQSNNNVRRNGTNGIGQPPTDASLNQNANYSFGQDAVTTSSTTLGQNGTTNDTGQHNGQLDQTQHRPSPSIEIVPPMDIFAHQNEGFAHTAMPISHITGPHMFSPDSQVDHFSPTAIDEFYFSAASTIQGEGADTETQFTMDYIAPPQESDLLASMYAVNSTNFWNHMMLPGFSWPAEDTPLPWEIGMDTEGIGGPMVGIHNAPIPNPPV